jgi:hypothetical protein
LTVKEEGTALSGLYGTVNFVGSGVAVTTPSTGVATVTISSGGGSWGDITGTLSNQTDLQSALNAKLTQAAADLLYAAINHNHAATYQPLDSDLTAIAALAPSNDDILQRKSGVWASRTIAQMKTDLNLSGTNTGDQDLSGLMVKANNLSDLTSATTARTNLSVPGLATANTFSLLQTFSSGITLGASGNLFGGTNLLEQRNGTNAQFFKLYETYTDASNYSRLGISKTGNYFQIQPEAAGSGTVRPLLLLAGGDGGSLTLTTSGAINFGRNNIADYWQIAANGHLLALTDNIYDIGASGASRPRHLYLGGIITLNNQINFTANSGYLNFGDRGTFDFTANGVARLMNTAADGFSHLQFGGATTGYSAISLSAAVGGHAQGLILQRADGTPQVFANLGAATNGSMIYCSDCAKATPCVSGGTGAIAKRLNGAWDCN